VGFVRFDFEISFYPRELDFLTVEAEKRGISVNKLIRERALNVRGQIPDAAVYRRWGESVVSSEDQENAKVAGSDMPPGKIACLPLPGKPQLT
jgi:hypothetical protein